MVMERRNIDPEQLQREEWNSLLNNYSKHDVGEAYFTGRMHQIGLQTEQWGIDMRHNDDSLIFDNKMDLRLWEPLDGQSDAATWPSDVPNDIDMDTTAEDWWKYVSDSESWHTQPPSEGDIQRLDDAEGWKLRGVADIKTKANESWLCAFNVRHFAHYAEWAEAYDVPVFVYFTLVNMDDESVGEKNILVPIDTDWNWQLVADHFDPDSAVTLEWPSLKDEVTHSEMVDRVSRAPDGNPVLWVDDSAYHNFDWFVEEVL